MRKLDPRAREALFLGYAERSKAYKLWDGDLQKIVISRDVVFDAFSSGVCGNVGDANTLDTDEDVVSLDIESDNNPSDNAPSSETVESESGEGSNSEPSDEELHESIDNTSPNTETPPSSSDDSSESSELPTSQVHSQEQHRPEPRRSGRVRNPVSQWWRAMYSAGIVGIVQCSTWNMHCTIVQYCCGGRYALLEHWWIRKGRALARRTNSTCCSAVTRPYTNTEAHSYTCMSTVTV